MRWLVVLSSILLLVVLGAGLFWLRARWRLGRRRGPRRRRTPAPVVLAHGVLGFSELRLASFRGEYFRQVPDHLRKLGTEVYALAVPMTASISVRAEHLKRAVEQLPAERVNIIAHSMGGLDARYAVSQLGLSAKVASLTTVGTPHRGTPLADLGTGVLGDRLGLRRMVTALGLDVAAFYDLTTLRMEDFNRAVPDAPDVLYASYLGAVVGKLKVNPLLLPGFVYLSEKQGANDGLVPVESQRWGEVLGQVEADHWAQIGWSRRFDARAFYAQLLTALRERGL